MSPPAFPGPAEHFPTRPAPLPSAPATPGPGRLVEELSRMWPGGGVDEPRADGEALDRALRAAHLAALSIADYRASLPPTGVGAADARRRAEQVGRAIEAVVDELHGLIVWQQGAERSGDQPVA